MPDNDKIKAFYDVAKSKNVPLPDYGTFVNALSDPNKRKAFYDIAKTNDVPLPDYQTYDNILGGQSQPKAQVQQPTSFMQARFPFATQGIEQAKQGNVVAGGLNIANQAVNEAFRPIAIANQYLRQVPIIGKPLSNIAMAVPEAISGGYDLAKSGLNATGIPNALNSLMPVSDKTGSEISQAGDVMNKNIAMFTMPQVAGKVVPNMMKAAGEGMQKLGQKFEAKAIVPPFNPKKGLEIFDRETNTALQGNYAPTRAGIQKLQNDLGVLNRKSQAISERSAQQGNTIDFKETNKMLDNEIANADKSSAFYDETVAAVNDAKARLNRIGDKYPDGQVPINIANKLKSSFQDLANGKYDQSLTPSQVNIDMYKKTGGKLLDQIIQQEPALRQIGLQQRNLIELQPVLGRKIAAQDKTGVVNWQNLRKLGVASAAGLATGEPLIGVATFAAEQALSKPGLLHQEAVGLDRLGKMITPNQNNVINIGNYPIDANAIIRGEKTIPPSYRNKMINELKSIGVNGEGLSDAELIQVYTKRGLNKPAPQSEAPVSRGGNMNIRGAANDEQIRRFRQQ